jgi:hypothetical protein
MTIVRPSRPALSRARRWVGYLCMPFAIAFLLIADSLFTAIGMPPGERSGVVRAAMVTIAVVPIALVVATPALRRVPWFGWMFLSPQPLAIVRPEGMELHLPESGIRTFGWDEIGSLKVVAEGWRYWGELRAAEGTLISRIPDTLVQGKVGWFTASTLAESIVQARPDRYALTDMPAWTMRRPDGFDLRSKIGDGLDFPRWRWRARVSVIGLLVLLALLGVVPTVIIFLARD